MTTKVDDKIVKSIRILADEKIESSFSDLIEEETKILSEMERRGGAFDHLVVQIVSLYERHLKTCLRIIYSEWLTHIPNIRKKMTRHFSTTIKRDIEEHFEEVYKRINEKYKSSIGRFSPSLRKHINADHSLYKAKEEALDVFHSELNINMTKVHYQNFGIYRVVSSKFVLPIMIGVVVALIVLAIRRFLGI